MAESEVKVKVKSVSCVRLCDPMDCSPPGSSIHGILQARTLEWVAISFSRAESEEELKNKKWKRRVKNVGLKLNIQKTKIMASGPIASWEIDGETVETVSDFIFWGPQITADGDCSHEMKRRLSWEEKLWPTSIAN